MKLNNKKPQNLANRWSFTLRMQQYGGVCPFCHFPLALLFIKATGQSQISLSIKYKSNTVYQPFVTHVNME